MIDRFLRRLPVSWRMLSAYLLVGLSFGLIILGIFLTYNSLIDWIGGLRDLHLEQQLIDLAKGRFQIFLSGGLALLGLGLVLMLFVGRSVIRQVNELREGVDSLRAGRLEVNLPTAGLDEMGLLARSINQLGSQLIKIKADQDRSAEEKSRTLKEHAVQLQTASELAREAATLKDLVTLTDRSVHLIQERFNFYHVGIYLVDDERRFIVLKAATGSAGSFHLQRGVKIRLGEVNVISNVAGSGEPRIINDVEMDYVFRRDPLLPDTRAEAVIPLKSGQEVMGVLDVHSPILNVFDEDDVVILQILADQLSVAIQNARLVQNLQQSVDEANSLYQRYTQTIWSREAMGTRVGGYEYNLLEVMPIDDSARHRRDLPADILERLKSGKATTVKRTLLTPADELQVGNSGSDPTVLLVPLLMYNQMVGVIGLEEDQPDHEWTDEEITVIEAVTNQIALSLDNARLLEESQIRSGQLRLLQEVTAVAASHTNLIELLDNVSQKLRASFNLLHCGMLLLEANGQTLSLVANASAEPFMPGAKLLGAKVLLDGNSIIERVFQERRSSVIYDAQTRAVEGNAPSLAAMQDFIQIRGAETIVFVPLLSRGEVIGVASLELADVSRQFSEADLQLMDQISLQISSAIDVARSFEQATLRAERERRVGEITSRIRETLDIQTILKTAAHEVRQALGVPEVTVRLASTVEGSDGIKNRSTEQIG